MSSSKIILIPSILFVALSFNVPIFSSCAEWSINATTFANISLIGSTPHGLFINSENTVYSPARTLNQIHIWHGNNTVPTQTISNNFSKPTSVFVNDQKDVFVDNGIYYKRVEHWISNTSTVVAAMHVKGTCTGLFVDINNTLYCSMEDYHQVIKKLILNSLNTTAVAAGNGTNGFSPATLSRPQGIYVDLTLMLYVADCGNDRIQVFQSNPYNGTTIAGNGSLHTVSLNCPTSLAVDPYGYLFIVDSENHRIVGVGSNGSRCVVGCSGKGNGASQLSNPRVLSFDIHGNIFVTDWDNNRIQKFSLTNNNCSKYRT